MIRLIRFFPVLLAAALLAGCAGFTKQAYTPSAEPIKQVLIVTPVEFPKVGLGLAGSPGLMFGALGAGIAAANAQSQGETLDQALSNQGGGYQKQLLASLESAFSAAGVRSQAMPAVPRDGRTGLMEDYKTVAGQRNVDAILDIFVLEASFGGTHPIFDPEKRPILRLRARLVSAKTMQVLYADDIFFGYTNPFMEAKEIKSPKKYYFADVEAINNDRPRAAEGMRVAATEVARFLVNQLTGAPDKTAGK
jgi:hypothetical protein